MSGQQTELKHLVNHWEDYFELLFKSNVMNCSIANLEQEIKTREQ